MVQALGTGEMFHGGEVWDGAKNWLLLPSDPIILDQANTEMFESVFIK